MKLKEKLKFINNFWCCDIEIRGDETIAINVLLAINDIGHPIFDEAEELVNDIDSFLELSRKYAINSIYSSDIKEEGGLTPVSFHVEENGIFCFWFKLGRSHRHLAVKYKNRYFNNIFCESP